MRKTVVAVGIACLVVTSGTHAVSARKSPGSASTAGKTIVELAGSARDQSTFAAAVKAAGLTDTLSGPGPFTVFVPTNEAFGKLPAGTVENLMRPENKMQLQTVLSYHIVPGALTTHDIAEQIKSGGGKAQLKTVQGEPLTAEIKGKTITITDVKGDVAHLTATNVAVSNGVVQVVNTILLP